MLRPSTRYTTNFAANLLCTGAGFPAPFCLSSFLCFFSVVAVVYLDRRAGDILHRYALPRVLRKAGLFVRDLEIPDKAVVDHHALGAVLAHALGLVYLDPVDQLGQKILRQRLHLHKPADRADELVSLVAAVVKVFQLLLQDDDPLLQPRREKRITFIAFEMSQVLLFRSVLFYHIP